MSAVKIAQNIYWVGSIDWNMREFHGHTYTTKRGTTYNAYLIVDDKVVLVDTVYGPFAGEMAGRIREILPPEKIDYVIANHVETDHSGALPYLMKLCPKATVCGSERCKEGLYRNYYGKWDFRVVKTGDTLELGRRTLRFIEAPMLHWPDSMFTYVDGDAILMPNDAFGQHLATSGRFDDETDGAVLMDEAAKYYGNILWPLSSLVLKKIEELKKSGLPVKMIAPSHGIIWRKDPMRIVDAYVSWARNEAKPEIMIAYETMWRSTELMARKIADGIIDAGVKAKLFDVAVSDRTEVIKAMLEAKGYLIGSSTHDNDMLPAMAGFLHFLKGLKPKNRIAAAFGSCGWSGGAVKSIEKTLQETGIEVVQQGLTVKYVPDENDGRACYEFGKGFAARVKG